MNTLRKASNPTLWILFIVVTGWTLVSLVTGALGSRASIIEQERLLPVAPLLRNWLTVTW
jgi:hypothetical protein